MSTESNKPLVRREIEEYPRHGPGARPGPYDLRRTTVRPPANPRPKEDSGCPKK